ncbi:DUF6703 family protein [Bailinhaonella thermotolerans]|uniref:Uncharacterized protein n=1 Tax=Bailinhaonella thermotolerans TaxID=1070861 RepID=A0A3A3ZZY2_9ACTN|nr:DUF6703 family protein [Bailinhaonella thermotolerans]RJL21464.1 hypothetical protein D5H75_37525 [Bailinhaonella thermotolerans]
MATRRRDGSRTSGDPRKAAERARRPRGRPLPAGERFFTPGATGLRKRVEEVSAVPLVYLYRLPRWVLPLVMAGLMLAGFVVRGPLGGIAVLPVLAFVVWLAYMSWPSLRFPGRLLRVALGTFLLLLMVDHFVPLVG